MFEQKNQLIAIVYFVCKALIHGIGKRINFTLTKNLVVISVLRAIIIV
jgi:hypothetical protein